MPENEAISPWQLILLIFLCRIVITITYLPKLNDPPGNQDVWIAEILSFFVQLLATVPIYLLHKRFPNQTIIQYSKTVLGKFAGGLVGIGIVAFFIYVLMLTLARLNTFVTTAVMPETPPLFFTATMVLASAYLVSKGLKVLGRLAGIYAVVLIVSIVLLFILLFMDMDFNELAPALDNDYLDIVIGSSSISSRTVEILALAMLLPYLSDKRKTSKVLFIGYGIIVLFYLIVTISVQTTLGVEGAKNTTFPFFSAIRVIKQFDFVERTEAIDFAIWTFGIFIKASLYYYMAVLGISQVFGLKSYKPLIIPTGIAAIILTMVIIPSFIALKGLTNYQSFIWLAIVFIIIIPLILLFVALARKKGVSQQ